MFKLEFETDNAAFTDGNKETEVANIIMSIAKWITYYGDTQGDVCDSNGNTVGTWELTDD